MRRPRVWVTVAAATLLVQTPAARIDARVADRTAPDVVIVVLDDARTGESRSMPWTTANVRDQGMWFRQAIVPTSVCCPSRASLLTGDFAHTTGVWSNNGPSGGYPAFNPSSTLATWLHEAGYRTGLFGKYLNGFVAPSAIVPPGWDAWAAYAGSGSLGYDAGLPWMDESGTIGSTDRYSTKFFGGLTEEFVRETPSEVPLFAYFAPAAPHLPATPERADAGAFPRFQVPRRGSYNEHDVSDKPKYVRRVREWTARKRARFDDLARAQLATLLSVDREIERIVEALADTGRLENTILVVLSDNGYLWGEHRLRGKGAPYSTSIRVPLAIRYDAGEWRGTSSALVANVDIAPTIAEAVGVITPPTDGKSLIPILSGATDHVRQAILLEFLKGSEGKIPSYCDVRTKGHLFAHYATGFEELYGYRSDPTEMRNLAYRPAWTPLIDRLRAKARTLCRPRPTGFRWSVR